jgi:hypothetical protein
MGTLRELSFAGAGWLVLVEALRLRFFDFAYESEVTAIAVNAIARITNAATRPRLLINRDFGEDDFERGVVMNYSFFGFRRGVKFDCGLARC